MNFQKKNKRFTKSSLISIIIAMIMCVGLSAQADVPLGDPVQVQVVDVNDNDTIVAAPDSDVNIYVRLVNVEFYTDPGIQAIQFVFTYPSDVLEIYYEEVDGKNIPNVDVFDVTSGDEDLLPWPVYAGFVDNTPGNPIIIGLAMNPVDAGWEDWDPGWYDADPPGDPPDFPIPPGEWPVNPEGIVYLMASGKIVEISAHVIGGPGDYPLVIDEILQEEIPPEEAIVPLAILNEYDYDPIPYDEPFPGTLRVGCPDTTPPVWDDTIGVQEVIPGPGQLTASWGTATDADSPPATYNLYYRDGTPVFDDPDTPNPDTIKLEDVTSPYTITGLIEGVEYCIVVRAQDSPEPPCEPNEDDNVVELCGTPPPPSEVTLSILPEEKSVAVGETFTLDIQIDSGQIEIDRIDMYITYDPARLELQEHVPGDPFTPGDFLPPECPVFINDPIAEGILRYSQGCFGPSNSSEGLVASLTFEALDLPPDEVSIETYVDFDTDPDRPTIVGEKGETEPIYPNLFGSTVIIRSCTQVPVHVPLDMFEGDCAPIFFKVCQDGEVVRELEPVIIQYPSGETDLEICPALPDGIYSFYAKEYHYLSEVVTDVIIPLSEGRIEFPALRGGDTNNDNTIDFENDAWVLIGLFEQSHDRPCDFLPEPEADPEPWNADINGNKVVDFENDAWSLIGNFEQSGDECSEIAASPAYPIISGINRNSEFRLSVNASPLDYKGNLGIPIGEEFEVAILAHNTTDISVYTFDLSYDSRGLKLIKSEGATIKESRFLKQNTARKPTLLYREKDTGFSRHVTVLGGVIGQTAGATGNEVVVATLRFQAISEEPGMISLNRIKVADSKRGYNILPSQQLHLKAVPKQTVVLQNYPNPFNPETWIPYNLANDAEVVIKIYNVSGKMVRSLDLGQKSAGYHVTRHQAAYWNGINELGESVSSGVYFYTIQAGDFVATRKMILLK